MTHADLFKKIAAQKLPEPLYRELEPRIAELLESYENALDYLQQDDYYDTRERMHRLNEIRENGAGKVMRTGSGSPVRNGPRLTST